MTFIPNRYLQGATSYEDWGPGPFAYGVRPCMTEKCGTNSWTIAIPPTHDMCRSPQDTAFVARRKQRMDEGQSLAFHIERSIARRLKLQEYPCACNQCRGAVVRKVSTIATYHARNGRDPYLLYHVLVNSSGIYF